MKKSTFSKILNKTRETKGEEVEIGQSNTIYKNHSLSPFRNASIFFYENNNGTLISVCFSDIFWAQLFLSTLSIYQFKNLSVFCALFLFNAQHFENSFGKEEFKRGIQRQIEKAPFLC